MSQEERFWARTEWEPMSGCCLWLGYRDDKGYGLFNAHAGPGTRFAHRLAYQFEHGMKLSADDVVRHTCDNPSCVAPAHLRLGTQRENIEDCHRKRRHIFGERHHGSRFTADDVREIRRRIAAGESRRLIAQSFGVWPIAIWKISVGQTWKEVGPSPA